MIKVNNNLTIKIITQCWNFIPSTSCGNSSNSNIWSKCYHPLAEKWSHVTQLSPSFSQYREMTSRQTPNSSSLWLIVKRNLYEKIWLENSWIPHFFVVGDSLLLLWHAFEWLKVLSRNSGLFTCQPVLFKYWWAWIYSVIFYWPWFLQILIASCQPASQ